MSDDGGGPPQYKTQQIPVADRNEILLGELKSLVSAGFNALDTKVDRLEANLELQGGEIGLVKKEVAILFQWKDDADKRMSTNSVRAKATTDMDMAQDARLAQEMVAREALSAKVDDLAATNAVQLAILGRLDIVAKNPLVKTLAAMLITAAITYLASRGVRLP